MNPRPTSAPLKRERDPESIRGRGAPLNKKDLALFQRILMVQSPSRKTEPMAALLCTIAKEEGYKCFVHAGNVYMEKQTTPGIPVGLVAHTDTVHRILDDFSIMSNGEWLTGWDNLSGRQAGVGGDDRCGIFMALMVARRVPNAKLFFPRDEEIGCVGAGKFIEGWMDECAFIMEADRRGWGDVTQSINYMDVMSKKFKKALKPIMDLYGMQFVDGMTTDIESIKEDGAKVCAFNMSASYYYPHTDMEAIYIPGVVSGIEFMVEVAETLGHRRWLHTSPPISNHWYQGVNWRKDETPCILCERTTWRPNSICYMCSKDMTEEEEIAVVNAHAKGGGQKPDDTKGVHIWEPCQNCGVYGPTYNVGEGVEYCADCVSNAWTDEVDWGKCQRCAKVQSIYPLGDDWLCNPCLTAVEISAKNTQNERLIEEVR